APRTAADGLPHAGEYQPCWDPSSHVRDRPSSLFPLPPLLPLPPTHHGQPDTPAAQAALPNPGGGPCRPDKRKPSELDCQEWPARKSREIIDTIDTSSRHRIRNGPSGPTRESSEIDLAWSAGCGRLRPPWPRPSLIVL